MSADGSGLRGMRDSCGIGLRCVAEPERGRLPSPWAALELVVGQPVAVAGILPLDRLEVGGLKGFGHRAGMAFADGAVVEFADGRQFGGGAAEERFVGIIDFIAGDSCSSRCSRDRGRS